MGWTTAGSAPAAALALCYAHAVSVKAAKRSYPCNLGTTGSCSTASSPRCSWPACSTAVTASPTDNSAHTQRNPWSRPSRFNSARSRRMSPPSPRPTNRNSNTGAAIPHSTARRTAAPWNFAARHPLNPAAGPGSSQPPSPPTCQPANAASATTGAAARGGRPPHCRRHPVSSLYDRARNTPPLRAHAPVQSTAQAVGRAGTSLRPALASRQTAALSCTASAHTNRQTLLTPGGCHGAHTAFCSAQTIALPLPVCLPCFCRFSRPDTVPLKTCLLSLGRQEERKKVSLWTGRQEAGQPPRHPPGYTCGLGFLPGERKEGVTPSVSPEGLPPPRGQGEGLSCLSALSSR